MIRFLLLGFFVVPAILASNAIGQDADCEQVLSQLKEAKSEYKHNYKEQKKAFENWDKYYKELHSYTYEATDQPLAVSAMKCEQGEGLGKDFCKGVLNKYNEISAKEAPAKVEFDAAKAKAEEARHNYNILVRQSSEQGCSHKK